MNKTEKDIINQTLKSWQDRGLLDNDKANELKEDINNTPTESNSIAQYFFIIAISCVVLAFGALFIDEKLIEQFKNYFALSNYVIVLITGTLATLWYIYVYKRKDKLSKNVFEGYSFLGCLLLITSLVYVFKEVGFGEQGLTYFLASATVVFAVISILLRSKTVWLVSILSLMGWYGVFTEFHSTDNLFFGLNYPMRFTVFGLIVLGISAAQQLIPPLQFSKAITYIAGLLIFFTGLWGVSIFGNYAHLDDWFKVRQTQVIGYSIVFAAFAVAAFIYGLKKDDSITRDFGLAFILINLYSRYFEFFWDNMNKGIFFVIMAASFWFVGRLIEKRRKKKGLAI